MVVSSCWCKEVRKKYWIQQINLRFQSIEQLWPSSIYALDTRWWSGNGHLLQNENYHKKLRKRLCSVLTPNVEYYRFEDVALGNSLYTIHILLLSIPRKYIKSYRNMNENRKYTMLRDHIKNLCILNLKLNEIIFASANILYFWVYGCSFNGSNNSYLG